MPATAKTANPKLGHPAEAVFRTIALYDALGIALTPFEIWRFLCRPPQRRPARTERRQIRKDTRNDAEKLNPPKFFDVFQTLAKLKKQQKLEEKWGMYVLPGKTEPCEQRVRQKKIADQKWKLARRGAKFLALIPFVRLVASNGSLAKRATNDNSDLDVLIVAARGRIWTARLLATLLLHILGWRRHSRKIKDRICLNHYITDNALNLRDNFITTPHMIAWMEPILEQGTGRRAQGVEQMSNVSVKGGSASGGKCQMFERFIEANNWVGEYLWNWGETKYLWQRTQHQIKPSPLYGWVRELLERVLWGQFGDKVEAMARKLQLWYMQRSLARLNPEEKASIKISDEALEFHPRLSGFYKEFEQEFEQNLYSLGLFVV